MAKKKSSKKSNSKKSSVKSSKSETYDINSCCCGDSSSKTIYTIIGVVLGFIIIFALFKGLSEEIVVEVGDTVGVWYVGKLTTGEVFDTNVQTAAEKNNMTKESYVPLEFTVGAKQMIKGFDIGVIGMEVGENKTLTLDSESAYGAYKADLVHSISLEEFETSFSQVGEPYKGMELMYRTQQGEVGQLVIKEVGMNVVVLDLNHKLAGETLVFEVQLDSIVEE